MAKIEIVPAVLATSWEGLQNELERIVGVTRHVQVDIVDGHFAPHKTWPYKDGDNFKTIVEQEHGMPHWEELDFEFDLMVQNPADVVMDYVHAGGSTIIVHGGPKGSYDAVQQLVDLRDDTGAFGIKVGVALAAAGNPDDLASLEGQFDFVQVMGIKHIGKQGEPLSQHSLYLLERLRHRYPLMPIQVDGGVRLENVKQLVAAGATTLVCGSAIFGTDDAGAAYKALYNEANGG